MKKLLFISLLIYFSSCTTTEKVVDYSSAPTWVQEHPLSDHYYIGIGVSKKRGVDDYRAQSKKNALSEISSSISVSVSSNSILQQQENNGKFKEMFDSSTETFTNNELSGCQQVGRWENGSEYWTYYKLSKAKVEEAKTNAIQDATISLKQALKFDRQNDFPRAVSNYALALSAIKPYLGDRLKTTLDGETIFLGQYIIDHYRSLINAVDLTYNKEDSLKYDAFKPIRRLEVSLTRSGSPVKNIPLKIRPTSFVYNGEYKFNNKGKVLLPAINATTYRSKEVVVLSMDVEQLIEESVTDDLVKEILRSYETTYLELIYRLNEPKYTAPAPSTSSPQNESSNQTSNTESNNSNSGNNPSTNSQNRGREFKFKKFSDNLNRSLQRINEVANEVNEIGKTIGESTTKAPAQNLDSYKNNTEQLLGLANENSFEDDKLMNIKQFLKSKNPSFLTHEVELAIQKFTFEDKRLELAKMLYPHTSDKSNYYTINKLFNFSNSKQELNEFINK